jgi:NAD(P)-dependent dehydrogenase (short-subunit alcohol dehydrogenase family)
MFRDKVVWITGGGSGIGKQTALAFAREGAKVAICGRTAATLEATAAEAQRAGGDLSFDLCDVSRAPEVERAVEACIARYGRLDILINNAGVLGPSQRLCELGEEDFDRVLAIDVKGVWLCMKYAILAMLAQGGGCIVNLSSNLGLVATRGSFAYVAAKHAVTGMTKSAAVDYGRRGIRVNAVCPAAHETEMAAEFWSRFSEEEKRRRFDAFYPATGRIGRVEEVVAAILFLCSEGASNIHGIALPVDGGFTAQ